MYFYQKYSITTDNNNSNNYPISSWRSTFDLDLIPLVYVSLIQHWFLSQGSCYNHVMADLSQYAYWLIISHLELASLIFFFHEKTYWSVLFFFFSKQGKFSKCSSIFLSVGGVKWPQVFENYPNCTVYVGRAKNQT